MDHQKAAIKLLLSDEVSGCGIPGKREEVMRIRNWASGIRVRASVGVAVMAASSWLCAAAEAQEESKRKVQRKERSWKLSVVSEAVPGKIGKKLTARIEGTRLSAGLPMSPSSKSP